MAHEEPEMLLGDRARTAAYFARLADSYGGGEYYARRRQAVIASLSAELASAREILDLGCGNGAYLKELRTTCAGARIWGADLTYDMLLEARRRAISRVSLVQADAAMLPFAANRFDLVFCSHVLPFVADLEAAVHGIARCIKRTGVLAATLASRGIGPGLRKLMGSEQWGEFATAAFGTRARNRGERGTSAEEVYRAAFEHDGLAVESRTASFSIGWPAIEEWIGVRWMPVASEAARPMIEKMLAAMRADERIASHSFDITESVLVGRKDEE